MKTTIQRSCPVCGLVYEANTTRLAIGRETTCSRQCSYILRAQKNTNRVITTCVACGKQFQTTPSRITKGHAKYCSKQCQFPPVVFTCEHCGKTFHRPPSSNARFCSRICANLSDSKQETSRQTALASWQNPESKARILAGIRRRSSNPDWLNAPHFQKGPEHPRYKGNRRARSTEAGRYAYKQWHHAVLLRDNFTCQGCGQRGGRLTAHHQQPWATNPALRYDIANGITLCYSCHNKAHNRDTLPPTRICAFCGEPFPLTKSSRKYCSLECAHKGYQKRERPAPRVRSE